MKLTCEREISINEVNNNIKCKNLNMRNKLTVPSIKQEEQFGKTENNKQRVFFFINVIHGVKENDEEEWLYIILELFKVYLKVKLLIYQIYQVFRYGRNNGTQSIMVK